MERGFTLIEMALTVAILGVLAGISLPVYQTFQTRNDLDITTERVASALRRAQTYSRGSDGDTQWGVEVQSTGVTLFKGTTFATRDTTYDETLPLPGSVTVAGLSEVLFSKFAGIPASTGNITLSAVSNDTRTVSINAKGMVSY